MIIENGVYLELTNRSSNRVIFSAAIDEISKETFDGLWTRIGDTVFRKATESKEISYFEIRVTPFQ